MNKIIIVGHPNSNFEFVEKISLQYGMGTPHTSKRENLSPQNITEIICKAYNTPKISEVTSTSDFSPLQVSAVWHGMALDLFLNNLEQKFWGWSDPYAIYTLDYWLSLDENLTFILVYNHPRSVLEQAANNQESFVNNTIGHLIDNWIAYNTALLNFYYNNRERCLLISSEQINKNTGHFLERLESVFKIPLNLCDLKECLNVRDSSCSDELLASSLLITEETKQEVIALSGVDTKNGDILFNQNIAEDYLLKMLLDEYPESRRLYEELQSVANIPASCSDEEHCNPSIIWESLVQQRLVTIDLISKLYHLYKSSLINYKTSITQQTEVQKILLSQLHQVQEELEKFYIQKKESQKKNDPKIEELKRDLDVLKSKLAKEKTNQDRQKQQLDRVVKEKNLMLTQLHLVQEELERYYVENKNLKQQLLPELYGAAERIKNQLEYRLGAIMIQHSRTISGIISMPLAIAKERKIWHTQYDDEQLSNLPPLYMYRDVHEANRVKMHLSYQLGEILVHKRKSLFGFITLPFSIYKTVSQFKKMRKNKI
ncbi:sulfotransferase family protein [Escherichia coli]|nr:sulfotransferase family protein [Escherichia coli]